MEGLTAASESGPSGWEITLAISTIGLTVATLALVLVAWIAAKTAIADFREAQFAVRADHARRRGEATMAAVTRFIAASKTHHEILVAAARDETKERLAKDPESQKVTIVQLLRSRPANGTAGYFVALQDWLDELEVLALGVRLEVYDIHVGYQVARGVIRLLWQEATPYVQDVRAGKFDGRAPQPSAYEHCEWLWDRFAEMDGKVPTRLQGTLPSID